MNPFPNLPNCTDLGNGLRMVETHDRGHCFRILEPDGKASAIIAVNTPPPPKPPTGAPYRVCYGDGSQEIIDTEGKLIAATTDEAMAKHICTLLIAYTNIQQRKAQAEERNIQ